MSRWIQTDDFQYLRKIEPRHYELIEAVAVDGLYMLCQADEVWTDPENDYQDDTIAIIKEYYSGGVDEFYDKVTDPDTREQYLAEMMYESKSIFLIDYDYGKLTEEQTEFALRYYTEHGEYPDEEVIQ